MQEKLSIKGNIVRFDPDTLLQDIEDILKTRFKNNELEKSLNDLYDPYLLKDMDKAVERIKRAKKNNEKVIIFGDYDVDGITSTSILMHFFKKIGLQASYRLPNRVKDGYGMKSYFMDEFASIGVSLVITVDCGTRDIEVVKYAKNLGIDVIITDHHFVPEVIPEEAVALINPKRTDCEYPFEFLSGSGVAFKLVMALGREFLEEDEYLRYLQETVDIAAIGTVADCMPLIDENRIIVLNGLKQIKKSRSRGIRKLVGDRTYDDLDADVLGFLIGPRLNAPGRLDDPYKAISLILNNGEKIDQIVDYVESINEKRRKLTKIFTEDAFKKASFEDNIIFYVSKEIEHGIIGIVASKLVENFNKPSIVLKHDGDRLIASCRSPSYFPIIEYLEGCKDYFLHFGGHSFAAGFTILASKFDEFRKKITSELNTFDFKKEKKVINVDKVVGTRDFNFNFLNKIKKYKPFGVGNTKPIFMLKDFWVSKIEYLGSNMEHLVFKNEHSINIVGFGFGKYYDHLKDAKKMDLVFDFIEDIRMGKRQLKAKVIDICI